MNKTALEYLDTNEHYNTPNKPYKNVQKTKICWTAYRRYFCITMLFKSFVTHWTQGIPIAIFLDDGMGAGSSFDAAKSNSYSQQLFLTGLSRCGFEISDNRLTRSPWLNFADRIQNTHTGFPYANESGIENFSSNVIDICGELAQSFPCLPVVGMLSILLQSIGTFLLIREGPGTLRFSWVNRAILAGQCGNFQWRPFLTHTVCPFQGSFFRMHPPTGSDAFIEGSDLVYQRNCFPWSPKNLLPGGSFAIKFALEAFRNDFAGHRVRCYIDDQNVIKIVQVCCMIKELQEIGVNLFSSTLGTKFTSLLTGYIMSRTLVLILFHDCWFRWFS